MITVTTPSGVISQVAGNFSASALTTSSSSHDKISGDRSRDKKSPTSRAAPTTATGGNSSSAHTQGHSHLSSAPPPFQGTQARGSSANLPQSAPTATGNTQAGRTQPQTAQPAGSLSLPPQQPLAASGPSTPSAVQVLANGGNAGGSAAAGRNTGDFNHAITFVNTIKQRYSRDQNVYKRFLEILQTYQRDGQEIAEVRCVSVDSHSRSAVANCPGV